ncbi:hypothetical protein [Phyllobacterium myrsinacearum]|uniref:Uncharacterized protein n=1 Tax=Phyllobacterium myrsinacearum TaxID=28101 RepID=A0A839ENJ7_9HYPH|nr:hypothetical protein [Phyllobacterium myrsinacearum]MBA8879765.1 hypothetical protein [Phyllobacterium myrsinacearum]
MGYALQKHDNSNVQCRFLVGKNLDGCWIVCDRERLVGGLFADKESAIHFATAESDHLPGAVWCAQDNDCLLADPWGDLSPAPRDRTRPRHVSVAHR